jgi:hypothetical protein
LKLFSPLGQGKPSLSAHSPRRSSLSQCASTVSLPSTQAKKKLQVSLVGHRKLGVLVDLICGAMSRIPRSINALFAHFETAEIIHFSLETAKRQKQMQQLDNVMIKHALRCIIENSVGPSRFDDSKPCLYYMKKERELDPFANDFDDRYISDDFQLRILRNREWIVYDFHGHPGDNESSALIARHENQDPLFVIATNSDQHPSVKDRSIRLSSYEKLRKGNTLLVFSLLCPLLGRSISIIIILFYRQWM